MPGAIDYEIGKRLHPEPPTEEELKCMKDSWTYNYSPEEVLQVMFDSYGLQ